MGMDFQCVQSLHMFMVLIYMFAPVLEGLATVLAGAASFWIIQDFPDNAKFLTDVERTFVIRRLQGDDQFSAAGENLKMKYIWKSLLDGKTWIASMSSARRPSTPFQFSTLLVIMYTGADGPLYAFSLFLPSIIKAVRKISLILSN